MSEDRAVSAALIAALGSSLVAGTMPELLKLIPGENKTLAVLLAVGFVILAISWISLHGRTGVGVAVFLKPTPASTWSDSRLLRHAADAKNRHISFFYVNVDELHSGLTMDERAELTQRVIEARLKEEDPKESSHISFYLTCSLANAYRLGQQTFNGAHGAQLRILEFKEISVHQVTNTGSHQPLPPLVLEGTPTGPQTTQSTYPQLAQMIQCTPTNLTTTIAPTVNRHALILNLTNNPTMITEATSAASGTTPSRYTVGPNDVCSSALVIESTVSPFPNDRSAYNELLKKIAQDWSLYLSTQAANHQSSPEGRLFIQAPSSLTFSLGALLPPSTKVIDYN
ncbi:hypothetical protein [Streptomyces albicerus]|uniref:hypothetical protein n=1 Tax=Streptomyces albicerus TaxID=2569859 RepID=UPI00124B6AE1|nr:hypothetical protein [Streptomyces albicerus]